jgi:hypothetical protein
MVGGNCSANPACATGASGTCVDSSTCLCFAS